MKQSSCRKKGFTLIELLVVISIIGILATIVIGPMNSFLDGASQDAAKQSLANVFGSADKFSKKKKTSMKWPGKDTISAPHEFAIYQLKKWETNIDDASIWFLPNDPQREILEEDGNDIPDKILTTDGSLDKFKNAFGYNVAVPPATSRSLKNVESGPFPLMWTRGLDRGDTEWSEDSPWEGEGGHVLFSNGKVEWYEETQSEEKPEGVFKKFRDDKSAQDAYTSDIGEAIPDDWEILKA
ncbi:MAG: type II secretion system protein, partial [Opitutae bacterium]|nr:type II secretion system protein [Opitutae bacterium]